jgi:hypothetical protein
MIPKKKIYNNLSGVINILLHFALLLLDVS